MHLRFKRIEKRFGIEVAHASVGRSTVIVYRPTGEKSGGVTIVPKTSVIIHDGALESVKELFRPKRDGGNYSNGDLESLGYIPKNTSATIPAHIRTFFGINGSGGRVSKSPAQD